jgi:hypothetical protein
MAQPTFQFQSPPPHWGAGGSPFGPPAPFGIPTQPHPYALPGGRGGQQQQHQQQNHGPQAPQQQVRFDRCQAPGCSSIPKDIFGTECAYCANAGIHTGTECAYCANSKPNSKPRHPNGGGVQFQAPSPQWGGVQGQPPFVSMPFGPVQAQPPPHASPGGRGGQKPTKPTSLSRPTTTENLEGHKSPRLAWGTPYPLDEQDEPALAPHKQEPERARV